MERKKQLSNVAFGGDWSEEITLREALSGAIALLQQAVSDCKDTDPRTPEVLEALDVVTTGRARAALLRTAFLKAAGLPDQGLRQKEMARVLANLVRVTGKESHV